MKNKQIFPYLGILFISLFSLMPVNFFGQAVLGTGFNKAELGSTPLASTKASAHIKHIRFGSTSNPINGLTITWRSKGAKDSIRWGYSNSYEKGKFLGVKRDGYEDNFYDYNFPVLTPNETIYYKIYDSNASGWTQEKTYSTADDVNNTKFSFLAMGDSRTYVDDWHDVSNAANTNSTDFTLFTGDIVSKGGDSEDWNEWFEYGEDFLEKNLVYHTIGNHECRSGGVDVYANNFCLPENPAGTKFYYSFTYGNAVFICLDTEEGITPTEVAIQYAWLKDVLQANADKTWKIVWFHRPFYTTGGHAGEMNSKMNTWFDAFDTYGVDMIFNGHDHMYERTKPIQKNTKVVDEYGSGAGQGRCQIVCGGAGAPLYNPGSASWLAASAKKFHYCKIEIDGYDLNLEVYDENNTMFDDLKIHKDVVSSVNEPGLISKVSIYPNPTSDKVTVGGDLSEISTIKIYNTQGQDFSQLVKFVKKGRKSIIADLSALPLGLYLMKTQHTTHKIFKK
jgi:hypothetical protein